MIHEFVTDQSDAGKRLDLILKNYVSGLTRAKARKGIEAGQCHIDGIHVCSPDYRIKPGQKILFECPDERASIKPENGDLPIIWHDDELAICNKPPNLTVHPCPSCPGHTLVNRLLAHFPTLSKLGGERPGIVHRLDKDTSGIMMVALSENMRQKMVEAFSKRQISKHYIALVYGIPPERGECRESIGRDPVSRTKMALVEKKHGGKTAHTIWQRLWHSEDGNFSLLLVKILTGRTHQIRVHLASKGYPIIGDRVYGPKKCQPLASRQMLHASALEFIHPRTKIAMHFHALPPEDFMETIQKNAHNLTRIIVTGNQGCGKSTFCKYLKEHDIPLIDSDEVVAELYTKNGIASQWLEMRLHDDSIINNGFIDRDKLFNLFIKDAIIKKEFIGYIHDIVFKRIDKFFKNNIKEGYDFTIAEIPLFFECGWKNRWKHPTIIVGVDCDKDIRWKRISKNRHWSIEKISTLEQWQMNEEKKMSYCDIVINNNTNQDRLKIEADKFYYSLLDNLHNQKKQTRREIDKICQNISSI